MDTPSPLNVQVDYMGLWHLGMFFGLALCVLPFVRKAPWVAIPIWALVLCKALYGLVYPGAQFGVYNLAFQVQAAETLAMALILPGAMLCLSDKEADWIGEALSVVMVWEIFCVWAKRDGLLIAPSFDTAFLAMYLPFSRHWLAIPIVGTVLATHGSTAQMIIGAELGAMASRFRSVRWALVASAALLLGVAYLHSHGPLLDGSERIAKWTHYLSWWAESPWRIAFGAGAGSFLWISVTMDKFQPPLFLHMHSDWLQILFEYGVAGVALTGAVVLAAGWRAWKRGDLGALAGVAASVAFGLTYHPLRFFPSALLVALIYRRALISCTKR